MDELEEFPLLRLRVEWRVEGDLRLQGFVGGALRGAFGAALRATVCREPSRDCQRCPEKEECAYVRLFRTSPLNPVHAGPGQATPPAPFVLEPPGAGRWREGDEFTAEMVWLGAAAAAYPLVIEACRRLGERGLGRGRRRLELQRVLFLRAGAAQTAFARGEPAVRAPDFRPTLAAAAPPPSEAPPPGEARIDLMTPLRIRSHGKVARDLDLEGLVLAMGWRAALLARCWTRPLPDAALETWRRAARGCRLLHKDLRWADWSTQSRNQGVLRLGGLVGSLRFQGDWAPLEPLFRFIGQVHVGKNASYGLGRVQCRAAGSG